MGIVRRRNEGRLDPMYNRRLRRTCKTYGIQRWIVDDRGAFRPISSRQWVNIEHVLCSCRAETKTVRVYVARMVR